MTGIFINLEGPDGAGKSTQATLTANWLTELGHTVTRTRQPGGTPAGAAIRQLLLTEGNLEPVTEALLFAADRAQLVAEVIRPALDAGHIVICDRYLDSSLALQGFGRGLGAPYIRAINERATAGVLPDLTLVLDMPVEVSLARAARRGTPDRIESAGVTFHERARAGLLTSARETPAKYVVIDATHTVETVQDHIQRALAPHVL